ncbi:MAG: hypothetical protein JKY88_09220, partial [Pseudomonadales bacterium]|nr:hypothetical protein [Pseudomonadales bacterium]
FYVTISTKDKDFASYTKLLRAIKGTVFQQKFIIETLQDDLSLLYSNRAYSMIHEIENLMRKFITFFMIANVGKDWASNNVPRHVKVALERSKPKGYASELQKLDFKDLGNFLFDKYQVAENSLLHSRIDGFDDVADINLKELKGFIPRSNWDNFFKGKIDCEDSYLKKKWQQLYELRNTVAHTSSLTQAEYEDIEEIVNELKPILQKAFNNLDKLQLESSERKAISEKVATTLDAKVGIYFNEINNFEREIRELSPNSEELQFDVILNNLVTADSMEKSTADKIRKLIELKGSLSFESIPSDENIDELANKIIELRTQIQSTWSKDVYLALIKLGGSATLEKVYEQVKSATKRQLFGSWKTSVRRAIYQNSSDTDIFDGKIDIYKKVGIGKWIIRSNINKKLLDKFLLE